ncbi:MAG: hypothetical protein N2044_09685, partial [Cyclobacteriaceae bacterium]|nr:hypothetical protein [Cyclobacteriaceae bacterium]
MKINNIVFSLLALAMLCSFKNCGEKEKFPEYVDMVFMIPVSISPVKENYFIGDTILIEINTPDSIREFYSSEYFKLKEFNFAIRLLTLELVSEKLYLSQQPGNASSFNVISEIGSFHISGSLGGYIATVYNDERYSLK